MDIILENEWKLNFEIYNEAFKINFLNHFKFIQKSFILMN